MMDQQQAEVQQGERFAFGDNWSRFLKVLNEDRIQLAERSLRDMLGAESLEGRTFLDIGSGSGLFSLAARRLGAIVHSFDYDPQSVACTAELRRRYFPEDKQWVVERGSALDTGYMQRLGSFDIVYSWGVLHHTGAMWEGLENAGLPVRPGGTLFIAIYNDQGGWSRRWTVLKRWYNRLPRLLRPAYTVLVMGPRVLKFLAVTTLRGNPGLYFDTVKHYSERTARGMSYWHDLVDWIGGYPFEVAKPEEIFDFYRARAFDLARMTTNAGSMGCNEYVFQRREISNSSAQPPKAALTPVRNATAA